VIEYRALDGDDLRVAEVWAPGPEHQTVWCLRPDGSAVVVKLATKAKDEKKQQPHIEIQYAFPALPRVQDPTSAELAEAARVVRNYRGLHDPYLLRTQPPAETVPEELSEAVAMVQDLIGATPVDTSITIEQYNAAQMVILLDYVLRQSRIQLRIARNSRASIGAQRFKELTQ
jgi:hypothetical protein